MKSGVVAVLGAMGLLVLTGPVHQLVRPLPAAKAAAPGWIAMPPQGELTSISYTGTVGAERQSGVLDFAVAGDGEQAFAAMRQGLEATGFVIEDRLTSVDTLFGASRLIAATDPVSGRKLQAVLLDQPDGAVLHLTYSDPATPRFASAE